MITVSAAASPNAAIWRRGRLERACRIRCCFVGRAAWFWTHDVTVWVATGELEMVGQPIPSNPVDLVGIFGQTDDTVPYDGNYELWLTSLQP